MNGDRRWVSWARPSPRPCKRNRLQEGTSCANRLWDEWSASANADLPRVPLDKGEARSLNRDMSCRPGAAGIG